MRPFLLFAGLALLWFVLVQDVEIDGDLPAWGAAALLVTRFFVDFIGAWLAVTMLRLAVALARLGWARMHSDRE